MGYVGDHPRECRLHEEKHSLRSRINYHPAQALIRCLKYLIVTGSLTNSSTIGAVTFHSWNLSAAKVNPYTASQVELKKYMTQD